MLPSSETSVQRSRPPAGGWPPRSPSPSPGPASGPPRPAGSGWSEPDSPQFSEVPFPVRRGSGEDEEEGSTFVNVWRCWIVRRSLTFNNYQRSCNLITINYNVTTVTWAVWCSVCVWAVLFSFCWTLLTWTANCNSRTKIKWQTQDRTHLSDFVKLLLHLMVHLLRLD